MYVYLWTGQVEEIAAATSVTLTRTEVRLYKAEELVASYERRRVFFCSRNNVAPFSS